MNIYNRLVLQRLDSPCQLETLLHSRVMEFHTLLQFIHAKMTNITIAPQDFIVFYCRYLYSFSSVHYCDSVMYTFECINHSYNGT